MHPVHPRIYILLPNMIVTWPHRSLLAIRLRETSHLLRVYFEALPAGLHMRLENAAYNTNIEKFFHIANVGCVTSHVIKYKMHHPALGIYQILLSP